ncbi:hypothetical protein SAMN05444385_107106 [Tritonibacter mobilis]|jgi:hypothetical protein|nr:hypothetical protein SAMN05444385_107106 [Tritonibacter mobilis]
MRLLLLSVLFLAGCASQVMQGYVGKPISEAILDYGPPSHTLDLSDGRRAFQWKRTNSGMFPTTSPTSATIYGAGGSATVLGSTTTYVPYSNDCVYTLTAVRQGRDYIVDGFRQPSLECE